MAIIPKGLTDISYIIAERFERVNTEYIKLMAKHIKHLGTLQSIDMHRLEIMARTSHDVQAINEMLMKETGLAINDVYKVYDESGLKAYEDTGIYYDAKGVPQVPFADNLQMQGYMESIKHATAGSFVNMANTTVISEVYKNTIDEAVQILTSGLTTPDTEIRRLIKNNVNGARVTYKSEITRRLDSAARMNILDGARKINQGIRKIAGEQFGADGVEIDAHGLCAEDHIDIQGRQYSLKKFELLNSNLKRPIGTCNCGHSISYIVLGVSQPAWDKKALQQARDYSEEQIEFNGNKMTRYQASQKMRQMETAMRYKKDEIIGLRTAGFDVAKEEAQLRGIQSNYRHLCNVAELKPRYERAYVPGYRGGRNNVKPTPARRVPTTDSSAFKKLVGGKNDPVLTDAIQDYHIPQPVRDKFSDIKEIKTYNDLSDYLDKKGIQLDTPLDKLKTSMADKEIPAVSNFSQKLVTALETYDTEFGKDALSKLKKIELYSDIDNRASYFFNVVGEHDPDAGTLKFRDWDADGRTIFHELAHALQDSSAGKNSDALQFSDKMKKLGIIDKSFTANTSYTDETEMAEKLADALGYGFFTGSDKNVAVIQKLVEYLHKNK